MCIQYLLVCLQILFEKIGRVLVSESEIRGTVTCKNTRDWEKTASIELDYNNFLYTLSLYILQALCQFLRPSMDCNVLDREIERSVTILLR